MQRRTLLELPPTAKATSNLDPSLAAVAKACPAPKTTQSLASGSSSLLGSPPVLSNLHVREPQILISLR